MGATIGVILGLGVFFFLPVLGIYHGWQLRERRSRKEFAIFLGQVWGIGLLIGLVQFFLPSQRTPYEGLEPFMPSPSYTLFTSALHTARTMRGCPNGQPIWPFCRF